MKEESLQSKKMSVNVLCRHCYSKWNQKIVFTLCTLYFKSWHASSSITVLPYEFANFRACWWTHNIITIDETQLPIYIPDLKNRFTRAETPRRDQFKEDESINNTQTSYHAQFFVCKWCDSHGFRIQTEYYVNVVQQARKFRRKSLVCDLYYLHDNAPIHTSGMSTAEI